MRSSPPKALFLHEFVTGGGLGGEPLPASWAAEGSAMRRALARDFARLDGIQVVMTLDARLADEPGPWTTIRVEPGAEPETFARLASECVATLCIAPETGGILHDRAATIERVGGHSIGSSPSAIALAGDKIRTADHLRRIGIAVPEGIRVDPSRGLPRTFPYPAVLKPIDGAGSIDTFFLESPDDLPVEFRDRPEALLQRFLPGEPLSASFLVGRDGTAQLIGIGTQDIAIRDGRFSYQGGSVPHPSHVPTMSLPRAVESIPGLLGWVGVDFLWDANSGNSTILEINPRTTTSYVGWSRAFPDGHLPRLWIDRMWSDSGSVRTPGRRLHPAETVIRFTASG